MQNGQITFASARFAAGIVAILVATFTRHIWLTIAVGMGTLWLIQAFVIH